MGNPKQGRELDQSSDAVIEAVRQLEDTAQEAEQAVRVQLMQEAARHIAEQTEPAEA